ncbi:MAG: molybdate ABC transporter substrate-binding protein [Kiritimatiellae bacterium]|nr:molybdate ABC transporter substrate-binding protein [Kiritimatiellia bacterium]
MKLSEFITCVCVVALIVFSAGCQREGGRVSGKGGAAVKSAELLIYCGAGIRPACDSLIKAFEAKHDDIKISATYAGSGRLLGQISSIDKGDLFMPGAELYVDMAVEKGLANKGTKKHVAYFIPVVFVKKGNPKNILSLADFKREGVRVGLGDERCCAVGKKVLKILEKNKIAYSEWEKNIVYKSATVNELGMAIQLGTVDVVITWDANARDFLKYGDIVSIPPENNVPSTIPIVVLKASHYQAESQLFIDFVTSEEGKRILLECNFTIK